MTYRLSRPGRHEYSATAGTVDGLKAKIAGWFPPASRIAYKIEGSEGWLYVNGVPFGYISAHNEART